MQGAGELARQTVVGTLMTNHGLAGWLDGKGMTLERTRVGDRYILERMREAGFNLGGEPSGHILMTDHGTSGDGLMAALRMLAALKVSGNKASEALRRFTAFPQCIINISCEDHSIISAALDHKALTDAVSEAEASLGNDGRVVIRPSGTEPLIRVMVEARDQAAMDKTARSIAGVVEGLVSA